MADDQTEVAVVERLVDDVLGGRRSLRFAPGAPVFVAANMLLLVGGALLSAVSLPPLLRPWVAAPPVAQLIGLAVILPSLLVPAYLTVTGRASGRRVFLAVGAAWLTAGVAVTAVVVRAGSGAVGACAAAVLLLALSHAAARTSASRRFALFKQRLRARRAP
jgi:hypothetical protein